MFWLVFEEGGQRYVWIQEASSILDARLKASLAGHADGFIEWHELPRKVAVKVPKASIGKRLDDVAARKLLARLG
jgi:hypothetical protein